MERKTMIIDFDFKACPFRDDMRCKLLRARGSDLFMCSIHDAIPDNCPVKKDGKVTVKYYEAYGVK